MPDDPVIEGGGPTVNVWPAHGARFLPGGRFDIRVEGTGIGPFYNFSASVKIDGRARSFTSGTADPNTTDGISKPGWGGFNIRGYSNERPGPHEIDATFTSSSGTTRVRSWFVVEELEEVHRHDRIKNVIMLLGDGMGLPVRTAARLARHSAARGTPRDWLEMDQLPTTGLVTTHSLDNYLTDSSPGFAAYSTGNHAANNEEGVYPAMTTSPFYQPRVENMAEFLHRTQGKVAGIVTTADVEDATPGAMAVHTGDRGLGSGIVDQFLQESDAGNTGNYGTGLRVLMGGGRRWFLPQTSPGSGRTVASDYGPLPADLVAGWNLPSSAAGAVDPTRDLISDFQAQGFSYASSLTDLDAAFWSGTPSKLLGLFHLSNMNVAIDKVAKRRGLPVDDAVAFANTFTPPRSPYAVDNDGFPDQPMLDEMASAAIKVLSQNRKGFVLLIEGASIDKQEHSQDADRAIGDALEFDRAVGVARRFAEEDGETLVLVLSDHECAGFMPMGALRDPTTGKHEGSLAYLRSLAPDNTNFTNTTQPERQKVIGTVFTSGGFPKYNVLSDGYPENFNVDGKILVGYGGSIDRFERWLTQPLPGATAWTNQAGMYLRGQSGRSGPAPHGGADVPVSAYAKRQSAHSRFTGTYQNIDVFFRVMEAVGVGRD